MSPSSRRALHQPFFPLYTSSPSPAPAPQPPSFPKYPSSSSSSSSTTQGFTPFFPSYPSPPPPRTNPSLPTFPANISSLVTPSRNTPHSSKLIFIISIPILALVLFILIAAFCFVRRSRSSGKAVDLEPGSDSHRLVPPNSTTSDAHKLTATSAPAPSEFLYLGTLVSSRGHVDSGGPSGEVGPAAAESPELRPLPPLSRQARRSLSSDDEFYSPSNAGSPAAACGPHARRGPGPQSLASSQSSSSPTSSIGSRPPPPPLPPRKSRHLYAKGDGFSGQDRSFITKSGEFKDNRPLLVENEESSENPFMSSPPHRQAPPPPPPPPPPVRLWESEASKVAGLQLQPPVLAPPKVATVSPAASSDNSDEGGKSEQQQRPRLKPLHWDKVRACSDRTMVWDHLKSSSFQLNEEMMETLFGCEPKYEGLHAKRKAYMSTMQDYMVLDPKKSQNVAILLRALNVTTEEVCEALLEGNTDSLGNELLETLLKMAPSKEEEIKLRDYKDDSPYKLGTAERFLKAMLDIPFAFKRVDAMLYIANFDTEVNYLRNSFEALELACEELRNSRLFRKLLDAVLQLGNRMNDGTNRGHAQAFKLDTLLKLVDVKGTDGKTSLLHFVVQEISKAEGYRQLTAKPQTDTLQDDLECKRLGLQVVSGLGAELGNVKKAATMDSEILSSNVSKLARGIGRVREVVRLNEAAICSAENKRLFSESMTEFLHAAEGQLTKLQAQEGVALSLVKEITEYFHGDSAKEEAHPFRIFMVVRDFLKILDHVCKEIRRANERSVVSSVRQFQVPISPGHPPVFPRIHVVHAGSSDDESSSMSSLSS